MEQLLKKMYCKYFYRPKYFYTSQMLNFRVIPRTPATSWLELFVNYCEGPRYHLKLYQIFPYI